ncbi:MAG: recombinase family protein, partial [Chloroflexi bacterium]|nr:recombinase family protein [Chloroflexota bacterium]
MDETRTDDLPYWVALHRVRRLGSVRFALLERAFPSLEDAWRASRDELIAAGLDAEGVLPRRGGRWNQEYIAIRLRDPVYVGRGYFGTERHMRTESGVRVQNHK